MTIAPDDYEDIDEQHTFTPGGTTKRCSTIQINSDDIVESSETFSAGLQSTQDVLEAPTSAFILITDDSSKYIQSCSVQSNILLKLSRFFYPQSKLPSYEHYKHDSTKIELCA